MDKYKKYIKVLGNLLVILSIFFIIKIIYANSGNLGHIDFTLKTVLIYLGLLVLGVFGYSLFAFAWVVQLKNIYPSFDFSNSFRIIALSQIAKYLPGNVAHFVGRFYLAKDYISNQDIAYTIFVEQIMFVVVSLLIGSFYVYYFDISKYISFYEIGFGVFALLCLAVLVPILLKLIRKKVDMLKLDMLTILKVFFIFCVMVFSGGVTIYVLTLMVSPLGNVGYLQCVSGFAISFLVGFVVPGAPGGVGVREYAFVLLFAPFMGEVDALKVIMIFRVVSLISDVILFGIGKVLTEKKQNMKISTP